MNIMVSACLLGVKCRYNGGGQLQEELLELMRDHSLIPVCPEQLGGLPTPRTPAERVGEKVMTRNGEDVTAQYQKGALEAAGLAKLFDCGCAVLKERSPSCGSGQRYDGTFQGKLTTGDGVAAACLKEMGIPVFGESQIKELNIWLKEKGD